MRLDILLGNDFLSKHNAIINLEKRNVKIGESIINLVEEIKNESHNDEKIINQISTEKLYMKEGEENKKEITCPKEYLDHVTNLLERYPELYNFKTRVTNIYEHWLEVKQSEPFNSRTYPIPFKHREQVKKELIGMLEGGLIERSQTNYINPIVVVKKKDGSIRICLDARKVNNITSPQYEKPVNIESIIGRMKSNNFYTKLDLKNSFWLIPLNKQCRKYTGFSVEGNVYQFCVVPFGLQSSTAALTHALQIILNKYEEFCAYYVDDILIFSENEKDHLEHIEIILKALDEAGLKLNIQKCKFFQKEVEYLGYNINENGININLVRLDEIRKYPQPKNLKTLRGFLGMLNYYRRFVPNLSEKQIPLIELLKKGVKWKWDEKKEKAFQELKNSFVENLALYNPDYNEKFIVRCDASDFAIAGELLQLRNGVEVPICFVSRVLRSYETRYSISEKEMLGLCFSISKLKFFLTSNEFIVETDHSALQYLMNNRFANNRIYRWSLLLQEYKFTIRHISGKTNVTADALSRMRETEITKSNTFLVALNKLREDETLYNQSKIRESQEYLVDLRENIGNENYKGYTLKDNFIIKVIGEKELYVVDDTLTREISKDLHIRFGHSGVRKTWNIFRENYYAKNDITIFKQVINSCELCCLGKYKNHTNQNTIESIMATQPLHIIAIDYISNLIKSTHDYKHILVIYDVYTKYIKLYPTKKCNTNITILSINLYNQEIGKPQTILTDNATYFSNDRFRNFCSENDIKLIFTSIRHPNANPVERYNQEVIKFLRLYAHNKQTSWPSYLNTIENYINHTPNSITHTSPVLLMKNELPTRPWEITDKQDIQKLHLEVKERLNKLAIKYKQKMNSKIKKRTTFQLGDLVIIRKLRVSNRKHKTCAKLQLPFEGPYEIQKILGKNNYELLDRQSGITRGKFHINLIYPYVQNHTTE